MTASAGQVGAQLITGAGGMAGWRGGAGRGVAMVGQSNTYSPSLEEAADEEVLQGCEAKSAEGGVTDAA